jgi:DNA-binding NarL/FixJ family response regulator
MRNNSVIIATSAGFLAGILKEKLRDADFQVFTAGTDTDLAAKVKAAFPRFVFLEHCFHGYGTDAFVQRTVRKYRDIRIVVWAASEVKPLAAARFIQAGAESFFSLRDTDKTIETILCRIAGGRHYCPAEVEAALNRDCAFPAIGEGLTRREIEIIKLSVDGKTNQQIGDTLSLSIHTVKYHKANIYRKCGGNTAVDIIKNGFIRGIINPEDF